MMRTVTLDQYAHLPRPQVRWLVEGLIPRPGMVMLLGPPKAGKSFLALDVAVRLSRGEEILGHKSAASRVLYIQLDTSEAIWRDRILALEKSGYNTKAPDMLMVHPEDEIRPVNVLTQTGRDWIRAALASAKPEMVVIDVLREAHTGDENDSTEMKEVFDELTRVLAGRSIFFVHHTKKLGDSDKLDPVSVARGSSYITGKMDAYWLLHDGKLHVTSRFEPGTTVRAVQGSNGVWTFPAASVPISPPSSPTAAIDSSLLEMASPTM